MKNVLVIGSTGQIGSELTMKISREIDGSTVEYDLAPSEKLISSTGQVAIMDATCSMDIQTVKGVKNVLFGGEGLFNTVITGPGHVVMQTMPLSNFAGAIASMMPSKN